MSLFRVLLVDDEEALVSALVERLKLRDIDAKGVVSGRDAIACVEREDFDVVVLDVRMPSMSGEECLQQIKSIRPNLNVILLTGYGLEENLTEGVKSEAFEYMMKPVDIDLLIEAMKRAVDAGRRGGADA